MQTLLVALDFSHATKPVLETAEKMAAALGGKVCLLHVEPPDPAFVGYEAGPQPVRDAIAQEARTDHARLHEARDALQAKGLDADALLIQGPTVEKILDEAGRLEPDWIVMGSHGHGALFHLVVGSISEGVIKGAACPVVVVPCREATDES